MKQRTRSVRNLRAQVDPLTEQQWAEVFRLRCRSKRGEHMNPEDSALMTAAWKSNPERYAEMGPTVFTETAPFGSTVSGAPSKKKASR